MAAPTFGARRSIGRSWGKTIFDVADQLEQIKIPDLQVLQLVGSMATPYGFSADVCSSNIAQKLSATCVNLHMPAVLSNAETAVALRNEPLLRSQLNAINHCNKTLFAAGPCHPDSHIVSSGVTAVEEMIWYLKNGAVGVVCGRFIDRDGNAVHGPLDDRMLGIDLEQMKGREMGILVSSSDERVVPAIAAIRGGYVTHLVTSHSCGEQMLATEK